MNIVEAESLTTGRKRVSGSFRDPSGFVFEQDGTLYRQINEVYRQDYDSLIEGGLYDSLVRSGSLVPHDEVTLETASPCCYRTIRPERIPLISYPYEWCFSELKAAALLTLQIQRRALDFGMTLKDASAYNVQFNGSRPVFIDTLSFERRDEEAAWGAYRQFCQHFLAPLSLVSRVDGRLSQMLRIFIDGIPLDLASRMLGPGSWLRLGMLTHIHLHARATRQMGETGKTNAARDAPSVSTANLKAMIDSLIGLIERLQWRPQSSEWGGYYDDTNYSDGARRHKEESIARFLGRIRPRTVWDFGANTGRFTQLAAATAEHIAAYDLDPAAVDQNYRSVADGQMPEMLPLVLDLANPSPDLGWAGTERMSLARRGPTDLAMALALVHHLAISNNVPLPDIADFFSRTCSWLIVEFVPKSDSQVKRMLRTRRDIFSDYSQGGFEASFEHRFATIERCRVRESERILYLMQRKAD